MEWAEGEREGEREGGERENSLILYSTFKRKHSYFWMTSIRNYSLDILYEDLKINLKKFRGLLTSPIFGLLFTDIFCLPPLYPSTRHAQGLSTEAFTSHTSHWPQGSLQGTNPLCLDPSEARAAWKMSILSTQKWETKMNYKIQTKCADSHQDGSCYFHFLQTMLTT